MISDMATDGEKDSKEARKEYILNTPCHTWADYVSVVLQDSGHVAQAAIHSLSGAVWASTPGFKLQPHEVCVLATGLLESDRLRAEGVSLSGRHFSVSRMQERRILVGRDAASGDGCVVYVGRRCLLAATYATPHHPGGCFSTVIALADYLADHGY